MRDLRQRVRLIDSGKVRELQGVQPGRGHGLCAVDPLDAFAGADALVKLERLGGSPPAAKHDLLVRAVGRVESGGQPRADRMPRILGCVACPVQSGEEFAQDVVEDDVGRRHVLNMEEERLLARLAVAGRG